MIFHFVIDGLSFILLTIFGLVLILFGLFMLPSYILLRKDIEDYEDEYYGNDY